MSDVASYSLACLRCTHEKCPGCTCPCHTLSSRDPNAKRIERTYERVKPVLLEEDTDEG